MNELAMGWVAGLALGFLMQRGRVLRFEKQVGALLLRDMTVVKFMLSAVIVGMVGFAILHDLGLITFNHKAMNLGAVLAGGLLFGVGWAVCGFCPGTAVGALGEGRWHAGVAILGMLAGAALHGAAQPWLQRTALAWHDYGKIGLPQALDVGAYPVIAVFAGLSVAMLGFLDRKGL